MCRDLRNREGLLRQRAGSSGRTIHRHACLSRVSVSLRKRLTLTGWLEDFRRTQEARFEGRMWSGGCWWGLYGLACGSLSWACGSITQTRCSQQTRGKARCCRRSGSVSRELRLKPGRTKPGWLTTDLVELCSPRCQSKEIPVSVEQDCTSADDTSLCSEKEMRLWECLIREKEIEFLHAFLPESLYKRFSRCYRNITVG